jgi:drug/metabolite transporter (DMT)-like permease
MGAVLLVVGCGLATAGFDLARKDLVRYLNPVPMVFLLALASVPLFLVMLWVDSGVTVRTGYAVPAMASVVLNIGAHLAFIQAVRRAPLSGTVPLLSLTPVFSTILAWLLLAERPTLVAGLGILLVVGGVWWLNLAEAGGTRRAADLRDDRRSDRRPDPRPDPRPGRSATALMGLTALLWSLTIPLDKLAVTRSSPPFHGLVLTAGIAAGAFLVLLAQRRLGELGGLRRGGWPFLLALVASTLALGFQLFALKVVLVSVVETVKRGLGNLLAVLFGRLAFGEPMTLSKLAAAVLMAAGVALILL